jgi:WD40 repeat protein
MSLRLLLVLALCPLLAAWVPADPPRVDADGSPLPEHALFRLGTLKLRHSWLVGAVAFSADGKQIVSVGVDLETHTWEADTGKELLFRKRDEALRGGLHGPGLALSRDGTLQALASGNNCALSDPATGKTLHTLAGHKVRVEAVAFSADGKRLATASIDRTACMWDTATGKLLQTFENGGGSSKVCVALSPDGRMLASGDGWGLTLWHVDRDKTPGPKLGRKEEFVTALAFSPDGKTLAALHHLNKPDLCLWDVATGKLQKQTPRPGEKDGYLACAPDGALYLIETTEKERVVRSVFTGQAVCRLDTGNADLHVLAFSPDGKRLVSGDGVAVRLWDTATGKELAPGGAVAHGNPMTEVVYTGDGKLLAAWGLAQPGFTLWDAQSGKQIRKVEADADHIIHETTATLASVEEDGTLLKVHNLATDRPVFQHQYPGNGGRVRPGHFSTSGKVLSLHAFPPEKDERRAWELHLWNLTTQKMVVCRVPYELSPDQKVLTCGYSWHIAPDDRTLVTSMFPPFFGFGPGVPPGQPRLTGTVLHFWDVESSKLKSTLRVPPDAGAQNHSGFILNGKYYRVVWEEENKLRSYWWDVNQGKKVPGSDHTSEYFNFGGTTSPDGKREVITKPGIENLKSLFLRDVESETIVRTLRLPTGTHSRMAFSPDAKFLATAAINRTACVWDTATGKLLHTIEHGSGSSGVCVALSPDGRTLAYGDGRGLALWHLGKDRTPGPKLGHGEESVTSLAFSSDGKTLAALHDRNKPTLCLWDVATGKLQQQTPFPAEMLASEEKTPYLGHGADGLLYHIDATEKERVVRSVFTNQVICRLASADADLHVLAFSPDGKHLATGDGFGVRLWDTTTGKELYTTNPPAQPDPIPERPPTSEGQVLMTGSRYDRRLFLWDASSGQFIRSVKLDARVVLDAATTRLALVEEDGTLKVQDLAADKVLLRHPLPRGAARFSPSHFSPSGKLLVLDAHALDKEIPPSWEVHVWNLATKKKSIFRTPFDLGKDQKALDCSMSRGIAPDDRTIVTEMNPPLAFGFDPGFRPALVETVLHFWDVESGKLKSVLRVPGNRLEHHSGFILNGKYFRAVWEEEKGLRSFWWDIDQGKKVPGSERSSEYFNFGGTTSRDGKLEALSKPGIENFPLVFLRDVESEKVVHTLRLPSGRHFCEAFSPDSKWLAVGGNSDVYLFATSNGELLGTLSGHRGSIWSVSFSPDGKRLVSSASDSTTIVWDLAAFRKKLPPE